MSKPKEPTNEEIINEITQGLNSELTLNSKEKAGSNLEDNVTAESVKEESDEESDKEKIANDYIDEERLKDLELSLTEEDKETRYKEALKLKEDGNSAFKKEMYLESVNTYTKALQLCPLQYFNDRSILYANRAASKIHLDRKQSAIDDCTKAIELNDKYFKAYLRRAKLYEQVEKLDESLEDYKKVLEFDPSHKDALQAQYRLPPLINERNEKLKTEMLGKVIIYLSKILLV